MILMSRVNVYTNQRTSVIKETPNNRVDRITWPVSIFGHPVLAQWIYKVDMVVEMVTIHELNSMTLTHQVCLSYC